MRRKNNKWKVALPLLIAAVLAFVFFYGDNVPAPAAPSPSHSLAAPTAEPSPAVTPTAAESPRPTDAPLPSVTPAAQTEQTAQTEKLAREPNPEDEDEGEVSALSCTVSISCATILDNTDLCNPEKLELVPEDGWILKPAKMTFCEGDSVFDILQSTCKELKIHMEYVGTPAYDSSYIEGIHNLYEFDVGDLSGWSYKVNGEFFSYGCSRYQPEDGDVIEWVYTCDLGRDVGG